MFVDAERITWPAQACREAPVPTANGPIITGLLPVTRRLQMILTSDIFARVIAAANSTRMRISCSLSVQLRAKRRSRRRNAQSAVVDVDLRPPRPVDDVVPKRMFPVIPRVSRNGGY